MPRKAVGVEDIAVATDVGKAVYRNGDGATPGKVNRRIGKCRKDIHHMFADKCADVSRQVLRILLPATKQHPPIGGEAEIVENEAAVRNGRVAG